MEACRRGERSNIIQTTNVDDAEAAVERYKIDKQGGDVDHEDYADSDSDDETSLPDVSRRKYWPKLSNIQIVTGVEVIIENFSRECS